MRDIMIELYLNEKRNTDLYFVSEFLMLMVSVNVSDYLIFE